MAYIESFRVEKLAGTDKTVEMRLDRNKNIFWGENGSGKTSLLKILSSSLSGDVRLLNNVAFKSAEVAFRIDDDTPLIIRRIEPGADPDIALEGLSDEDALYQEVLRREQRRRGPERSSARIAESPSVWSTQIEVEGADEGEIYRWNRRSFRHTYLPLSRLAMARSADEDRERQYGRRPSTTGDLTDEGLAEAFAEQVTYRWHDYANSALFTIRQIQEEAFAKILALLFGDSRHSIGMSLEKIGADEAYELVREFMQEQKIHQFLPKAQFVESFDSDQRLRRVVAEVREVGKRIDNAMKPQEQFKEVIDSFYSHDKHLQIVESPHRIRRRSSLLRVTRGGAPLKLQLLSSGEKQLLQLTLEVLAAENTSVLIDEPELSMHVDWQQRLVGSMRKINPECQLILATHSPEIMAHIKDEFIHQL